MNPEARKYYQKGLLNYRNKDYEKGLANFQRAQNTKGEFPEVFMGIGICNYYLKKYVEALKWFQEVEKLDPNFIANDLEWKDANHFKRQATCYFFLTQYSKSIVKSKEAIRLNPEDATAYFNRGLTYNKLKQYEAALADYGEAIRLNPEYATAYNSRGVTYYELKQYEAALADYGEAIRLNPEDATAYFNRGVTYYELKQYEAALADYGEAIRLNPEYAKAYFSRGVTYDDLKQYEAALADYGEAIRLNPEYAKAYFSRGVTYNKLKQYEAALADYGEAIRLNPEYAKAYFNRGLTYYELKQYQDALTDLSAAIKINPYVGLFWDTQRMMFSQLFHDWQEGLFKIYEELKYYPNILKSQYYWRYMAMLLVMFEKKAVQPGRLKNWGEATHHCMVRSYYLGGRGGMQSSSLVYYADLLTDVKKLDVPLWNFYLLDLNPFYHEFSALNKWISFTERVSKVPLSFIEILEKSRFPKKTILSAALYSQWGNPINCIDELKKISDEDDFSYWQMIYYRLKSCHALYEDLSDFYDLVDKSKNIRSLDPKDRYYLGHCYLLLAYGPLPFPGTPKPPVNTNYLTRAYKVVRGSRKSRKYLPNIYLSIQILREQLRYNAFKKDRIKGKIRRRFDKLFKYESRYVRLKSPGFIQGFSKERPSKLSELPLWIDEILLVNLELRTALNYISNLLKKEFKNHKLNQLITKENIFKQEKARENYEEVFKLLKPELTFSRKKRLEKKLNDLKETPFFKRFEEKFSQVILKDSKWLLEITDYLDNYFEKRTIDENIPLEFIGYQYLQNRLSDEDYAILNIYTSIRIQRQVRGESDLKKIGTKILIKSIIESLDSLFANLPPAKQLGVKFFVNLGSNISDELLGNDNLPISKFPEYSRFKKSFYQFLPFDREKKWLTTLKELHPFIKNK